MEKGSFGVGIKESVSKDNLEKSMQPNNKGYILKLFVKYSLLGKPPIGNFYGLAIIRDEGNVRVIKKGTYIQKTKSSKDIKLLTTFTKKQLFCGVKLFLISSIYCTMKYMLL